MDTLPFPACPLGYPVDQLKEILGSRYNAFSIWMRGQTMAICDGRRYNHDEKEYEPTECVSNPHGGVVYQWDLQKFLTRRKGQPDPDWD